MKALRWYVLPIILQSMSNKIFNWLYNPAAGVLPLVLFLVLQHHISYYNALLAGTLTCVVIAASCLFGLNGRPPYMMITSVVVFLLYLLLTSFYPFNVLESRYAAIIIEILFLCGISLIVLLSSFFKMRLIRMDRKNGNEMQQLIFNEYVHVIKCYQYLLFIHLLVVVAYLILPEPVQSSTADWYIYTVFPMSAVIIAVLLEYVRLFTLWRKIAAENWLPVVNETGNVIGKVAFSISHDSIRMFLHPVIRIALIYRGMFYLVERPSYYILDPGKIDYPFEKYVRFNHTLEETVAGLLQKQSKKEGIDATFIFRYIYKGEVTHRLIYLYAIRILDAEDIQKFRFKGGKLWPEKQIQENLGKNVFSECFEKEYEVLKNTVLMAEKL